jgi:hypothetical protein
MLNEGIVTGDSKALVKSEMIRQLHKQQRTTPDALERAVFEALTGGRREDVDWEVEDNKAGYFLWTKTFDGLISELQEDGYLVVEKEGDGSVLVPTDKEPDIDVSQMNYPKPG